MDEPDSPLSSAISIVTVTTSFESTQDGTVPQVLASNPTSSHDERSFVGSGTANAVPCRLSARPEVDTLAKEAEIMRQVRRKTYAREELQKCRSGQQEQIQRIEQGEQATRKLSQTLEHNCVELENKNVRLQEAQAEFNRAQHSYDDALQNLRAAEENLEGSRRALNNHQSTVERLESFYNLVDSQISAAVSGLVNEQDRAWVDEIMRGDAPGPSPQARPESRGT